MNENAWIWLLVGVLCLFTGIGLVFLLAVTGATSLATALLIGAIFAVVVALFLRGYLRRLK